MLRLTLHHHVESQELLNYEYSQPDASQYQCYQGVYFREWYFDSMDEFLIPLLCDAKKEYGKNSVVFAVLCNVCDSMPI